MAIPVDIRSGSAGSFSDGLAFPANAGFGARNVRPALHRIKMAVAFGQLPFYGKRSPSKIESAESLFGLMDQKL